MGFSRGVTIPTAVALMTGIVAAGSVTVVVVAQSVGQQAMGTTPTAENIDMELVSCSRQGSDLNVNLRSPSGIQDTSRIRFSINGEEKSSEVSEGSIAEGELYNATIEAPDAEPYPVVDVRYRDWQESFRCISEGAGQRTFRVVFNPSESAAFRSIVGNYTASSSSPIITGSAVAAQTTLDLDGNLAPENPQLTISDFDFPESNRTISKKVTDGTEIFFPERDGLGDVDVNFYGETQSSDGSLKGDSETSSIFDVEATEVNSANITFTGRNDSIQKESSGSESVEGSRVYYATSGGTTGYSMSIDLTNSLEETGTYYFEIPYSQDAEEELDVEIYSPTDTGIDKSWDEDPSYYDDGDLDFFADNGEFTGYVEAEKGDRIKADVSVQCGLGNYNCVTINSNTKGVEYQNTTNRIKVPLPERSGQKDITLNFTPSQSGSLKTQSYVAETSFFAEDCCSPTEEGTAFTASVSGTYDIEIPWEVSSSYSTVDEGETCGRAEVRIYVKGSKELERVADASCDEEESDSATGTFSMSNVQMDPGDTIYAVADINDFNDKAAVYRGKLTRNQESPNIEAKIGSKEKTVGGTNFGEEISLEFTDIPSNAENIELKFDGGLELDYEILFEEYEITEDPKVELVSSEGSEIISFSGTLEEDEKVKRAISLSKGTYELNPGDASSGLFNWSIEWDGSVHTENLSLEGSGGFEHKGVVEEGEMVYGGSVDPESTDSLTASVDNDIPFTVEKVYQNIPSEDMEVTYDGVTCSEPGSVGTEYRCTIPDSTVSDGSMDIGFSLERGLVTWNLTYEAKAEPEQGKVIVGGEDLEYPEDFSGEEATVDLVTIYKSGEEIDRSVNMNTVDGIPTSGTVDLEAVE